MDLTELDGPTRRARLESQLSGKPLLFDLAESLDELESRTTGMTGEQLTQFVDEATRKAALRAIGFWRAR